MNMGMKKRMKNKRGRSSMRSLDHTRNWGNRFYVRKAFLSSGEVLIHYDKCTARRASSIFMDRGIRCAKEFINSNHVVVIMKTSENPTLREMVVSQ